MKNTIKIFAAVGALALVTFANATPVTIVNGSFEAPASSGGSFDTLYAVTTIPGWTVSSGSVDHIGSYWAAQDGARSLDMNGLATGVIQQSISLSGAGLLTVNFWMAGNPDAGPAVKHLEVSVVGLPQVFTFDITGMSHTSMGWVEKSALFSVPGAGNYTLQFASLDSGFYGPALDNVTADLAVPDGGTTVLLLGAALTGIAALRRKIAD